MIKELVQFVEALPEDALSKNLKLREGLYLFLDLIEQNGKPTLQNVDTAGRVLEEDGRLWTSKTEPSPFFQRCLQIQMNTIPVSPQKIFNPDKKIFNLSCSPFALAFSKKNYRKYAKNNTLIKQQLTNQYFKSAEKYLQEDYHHDWYRLFRDYVIENLQSLLANLPSYQNGKDSLTVNIYFKRAEIKDFIQTHQAYVQQNVFNKAQYTVQYEDDLLGISDSLSGFNDKKRFLRHRTGFSNLNYRVNAKDALALWKFFRLQQNKQLPNPTPVFVDKEELDMNVDMINFHQDEQLISYASLIKALINKHKKQLHNFYLIFFQNKLKGSKIVDFDFVPVFEYEVTKPVHLIEVFALGGRFSGQQIKNVFDLLNKIFNKVFNGQLIQNTKDGGVWVKFFGEIEVNPQYYLTDTIVDLLYKYRQSIYDYVYKSRHEALTALIFDDMLLSSIADDIHNDKEFNRDYAVKEKLNIWLNFWDYFTNTQNRPNMANKTLEISNRLKAVTEIDTEYIDDDEEFAFAAGQLLWRILVQSKSANRSHALLEPFLQKVDSTELKKAIARAFDTYKHEFAMYPKKYGFDKIMAQVMGYEPKETNMKNLIHMLLAGYFAESM